MSGIIPPSILALNYPVDGEFKKYVNISFPFRVQIEKIWFTADDGLSGEDDGEDPWNTERVLRLGAVKTRNARTNTGAVTDNNWVWGDMSASNKPTCWFGNPDWRDEATDAGNGNNPNDEQAQYDDLHSTVAVYRSTTKTLPSVDDMDPWWNSGDGSVNYKTDLSVMNEDEFLSVFVYSDGGDWSEYTPYTGTATIFVSYTGVGGNTESAPVRIWD